MSSQKACGPASPAAAEFHTLPTHALASSYAKLLVHTFMPGHILFRCAPCSPQPQRCLLVLSSCKPSILGLRPLQDAQMPLPIFLRDQTGLLRCQGVVVNDLTPVNQDSYLWRITMFH